MLALSDNWWLTGTGAEGFPKTWSARDGATEPYMDVFTGVFQKPVPVHGAAELQQQKLK